MKLSVFCGVSVDGLIDDVFPLDQAAKAFQKAATKGVLKVLLTPAA